MIAAVIQARMGSTRLPGKTLTQISGRPLLQHLVERAKASRLLDDVIIATTTNPRDDVLVEFSQNNELKHFRGSEKDVLDRIYCTACHYGVMHIVRITPDCPLLDPDVMDKVIEAYHSGQYDYITNTLSYTYPDGLDVEVFSFQSLERAWKEATLRSEREHVTPYIRNNPHFFKLKGIESQEDLSAFRWTVDEPEDLEFVRRVFQGLERRGWRGHDHQEVVRVIEEDGLQDASRDYQRNEGLLRSQKQDSVAKWSE